MQYAKNTQFATDEIEVLEPINDIEESISYEELEKFRNVESPEIRRVSFETLTGIASQLSKRNASLLARPILDLSPRHPYDTTGLMDFYQAGRWDCTTNWIYMSGIKTGPAPGQWDGTVGYLQFKAPKDGTYLIVVHFTGYQITMKFAGPWGVATGTTAKSGDPGVVSALWTAKAGDLVFPNITCVYPNLADLNGIQAYQLS